MSTDVQPYQFRGARSVSGTLSLSKARRDDILVIKKYELDLACEKVAGVIQRHAPTLRPEHAAALKALIDEVTA